MNEQQREDRKAALNEACRHRLADEKADQIVANARKYYDFLQGDENK